MENGKVKVELVTPNNPKAILDNYEDYFNDGKWHIVVLTINTNLLILNIDNRPMRTVRILKMTTGGIYYIGGKLLHILQTYKPEKSFEYKTMYS